MIPDNDNINHDLIGELGEFLGRYYEDEIVQAVQEGATSITVEYKDLYQFNHDIAADYVENPDMFCDTLDRATYEVDIPVPGSDNILADMVVRVTGVDVEEVAVNSLRNNHRGKYLGLRGQVSRATQVRPKTIKAVFRCDRCSSQGNDTLLEPVPQFGEELQLPDQCPGCERKGPFTLVEEESTMVDHQILELADEPGENMGANSHTVPVHLYRDEAGGVMPGDRIRVNGKITTDHARSNGNSKIKTSRPWRVEGRAVDPEEVAFSEVTPERVEEIEALADDPNLVQKLIDSVAPNIVTDNRGDMHKLAILLQMFGGVKRNSRRGDLNVFLVGSKGTGKSQMLSHAAELAPKSVQASGKGATAAGLTATATQSQHGGWMLDAGALVLASGGMASIDEFDKMNDGARKSMHEAMEDQRVPINKAGINTVLPTETAILAAANPMGGEFDRTVPLTQQINLEAPLISRFDLIFGLIDDQDEEWDRMVATSQYESEEKTGPIEDSLITEYVAYARQNVEPVFADSSVKEELVEWYVTKREEHEGSEGLNLGPRTNDALRRLAEASARMRLSETIELEDAERAIELKKMHIGDVMLDRNGNIDAAKGAGYSNVNSIREAVEMLLTELEPPEGGVTIDEIVNNQDSIQGVTLSRKKVTEQLEKFMKAGEAYEPQTGEYVLT